MTRNQLLANIEVKQSLLCVGLDPDLKRMPQGLKGDAEGVATFCKLIIDATADHAVAYKPNFAFFEALGRHGWQALDEVAKHLSSMDVFTIADAKRGDIGNTASQYAQGILGEMGFDAITVAPYMGKDSVTPFFMEGKWAIGLGLTSNDGAEDFQMQTMADGRRLHELVLDKYDELGSPNQLMVVVGATRTEALAKVRARLPEHIFLVPGVGAQGGTVQDVMSAGAFKDQRGVGLLINASRSILYASSGLDFAAAAAKEASSLHASMRQYWPA